MGSLKPVKANWENTAGKRAGMTKGAAPAPATKVHGSAFGYAPSAKADPKTYGQSSKAK
jgi:hypothetical protein